jgi:hypothetical protein
MGRNRFRQVLGCSSGGKEDSIHGLWPIDLDGSRHAKPHEAFLQSYKRGANFCLGMLVIYLAFLQGSHLSSLWPNQVEQARLSTALPFILGTKDLNL